MSENTKPQYNTHNLPTGQTRKQRVRLYAILRIIDNRLQALAPSDPEDRDSEPEWTDLGAETCLWDDRETAFQIGRAHGGLLVSADGIPGGHRVVAFHTRCRTLRLELEGGSSEESEPATEEASKPSRGKEIAANMAKARAVRMASKAAQETPEGEGPF